MTTATTTTTTTNTIRFTSRSGNGIGKTGSFNYEHFTTWRNFNRELFNIKTHHISYSITVSDLYSDKMNCHKRWTVYYVKQNKNKTWKQRWETISCDSTTIDEIIGAEKRIELENQLTNELVAELQNALVAIDNYNK